MVIEGFQGEHRKYSNFYPCIVVFEGLTYKSSEAAYQASKFLPDDMVSIDEDGKEVQFVSVREYFSTLDARDARTLGKAFMPIREDWESEKLNVMYRILRAKYTQNPDLRQSLIATGNEQMVEVNYWHDTFWGVYNDNGENHLGRLIMVVRDELNEGIV